MKRVKNPQRVKPIPADQLKAQYAPLFDQLPGKALKGENSPVNVFGILLHSPEIAKIFIPYWVKSKSILNLTIREQELIILRMACLFGCDYVWGHHVPVMKEIGISDQEIANIPLPPEKGKWNEKETILLKVTDALVKTANITDEDWARLIKSYKTDQILDIITVVSQYVFFNAVNNVFGVKLEHAKLPPLPA